MIKLGIPVPLATKIYYSQRNHDLRRAIRDMFYDEPSNVAYYDASNSELVQANVIAAQTSSNSSFDHEQDVNQQVSVKFELFTVFSSLCCEQRVIVPYFRLYLCGLCYCTLAGK